MSESEAVAPVEGQAAISPFQAISAGIVAAGSALGLSEILSGLSRKIPSLVVSVADIVVDNTPGFIARWSIDTLGSNQKPALVWGIVVVSVLLGAVLGWPSRKRWWAMPAGLVVFAVVGGWAAARNPLGSDGLGWMSGLLSGAFGIAVFMSLYALALFSRLPGDEDPSDAEARPMPMVGRGRFDDRRRFVGAVGIMAGASLAGGLLGRWLRRRDTVEGAREGVRLRSSSKDATIATPTARADSDSLERSGWACGISRVPSADASPTSRRPKRPPRLLPTGTAEATAEPTAEATPSVTAEPVREPNFDYIAGIAPLITPNEDFYLIDTALSYPQVDPEDWSLRIHGMVDREVEISFAELLDLGLVREQVTLSCVSNRVGGRLVGNAEWVGVPLATVLDQAGVQPGATQIVGRSVDRWTAGFPTEVALDGRIAMVAVQMNGEPLPISHGFPARLVVAGLYGYVSATKWLSDIELTTWEAFNGYWIPRGWSKEGPIKTQSRVDVPRRDSTIDPGPTAIAGIAWAPSRAIERVEVQVDDEPWVEAELSRETTVNSWRQWMVTWDATPGDHQVRVRATDGTGTTQTSEISDPAPDGATGWHTIKVRADEA